MLKVSMESLHPLTWQVQAILWQDWWRLVQERGRGEGQYSEEGKLLPLREALRPRGWGQLPLRFSLSLLPLRGPGCGPKHSSGRAGELEAQVSAQRIKKGLAQKAPGDRG